MQELVCFGDIRNLEFFAVPHQSLSARPNTDRSQQDGFGQGARKVEVRAGRTAGLAGLNPLFVMADRSRQRLGPPRTCPGATVIVAAAATDP